MRKLIVGLGLAALWLGWNAPNHYPPWTTFHTEMFASLGVCLLCLAVFPASPASRVGAGAVAAAAAPRPALVRLPAPRVVQGWLFVACLPLVQYAFGALAFRGDAVVGALYGVGVALGLYAGRLWAAQQGPQAVLRTLFTTLVAGGLAANGLALAQWFRLPPAGWWAMEMIDDRPFANMGQPNNFGLLMVMSLIAVTALFEMAALRRRWVYWLAAAYFGWGVLISQSRASMLAVAVVLTCWVLTRRRVPTRLRLAEVAVAAALGLLLSVALAPIQTLLLLKSTALSAPAEVGPRRWIWLHFATAILDHPWWGYGFEQGVKALAAVADRVHPSRSVLYAHNLVLDLMAWFGIPLALALTAALGWFMLQLLRRDPDAQGAALRHCVFAIWLALLVQSMLEFQYAHSFFVLPAALLAGSVAGPPPPGTATVPPHRHAASRGMAVLAVCAAAVLGRLGWEYFQIESDFRVARFARANFANRPRHDDFTRPWILDQLAVWTASAHYDIAPGMPAAELQNLHALARRFNVLSVRYDYARALALNGEMAAAEAEMRIIRSVYPDTQYRPIEREWRAWLAAHAQAIAQGAADRH